MKKDDTITREEALAIAQARKEAGDPNIGMFYSLLQDAHPSLAAAFEDRLVSMIQLGVSMGRRIGSLEPGTPEYNQFVETVRMEKDKTSFERARDSEEDAEDDSAEEEESDG